MTEKEEKLQNKLFALIFALLILIATSMALIYFGKPQASELLTETITNVRREYVYDEYAYRLGINEILSSDRDLYFNAIGHFTNITRNSKIAETILDAALSNNVPVNVAFAIAWQESRFNSQAINENGNGTIDNGLFQINEYYHPAVDAHDIVEASHYAMEYLNIQYRRFDSWDIAIVLYNAGNVENLSDHSMRYLASVLEKENEYNERFNNFRRSIGVPNIRD